MRLLVTKLLSSGEHQMKVQLSRLLIVSMVVAVHSLHAQTLTILHSFTGGNDGGAPYSELTFDSSGNLFGTTFRGGKYGSGVVFKLQPNGKEVALHNFSGARDGGNPYYGALAIDALGNLYGTTLGGGRFGAGVAFKLTPTGGERVLHAFSNIGGDGESPIGSVTLDAAGNLYGTTQIGGNYNCNPPQGCGTVFKIDTTGHLTILHAFNGSPDGAVPHRGLTLDKRGNLYGTTFEGGTGTCNPPAGCGTVFRINTAGKEKVLHSFGGYPNDGQNPDCNLVRDTAGNLYGTTVFGGTSNWGMIFKLSSLGVETVLYNFAGGPTDGAVPVGTFVRDSAGNLYGVTNRGGTEQYGTIFQLDSSGKESILHDFSYSPDGGFPWSGLIQDSLGNFYGAVSIGGSGNCGGYTCGMIFKFSR
jgi:uncharacterized repeat protein (TIGR03803 family)